MSGYSPELRRRLESPAHAGDLPDVAGAADVARSARAEGSNPACGDVVAIALRAESGRIAAARWRAHGCPHLLACAEAVCEALEGAPAEGARAPGEEAIAALLGGLAPTGRHAAALVGEVAARAVAGLSPAGGGGGDAGSARAGSAASGGAADGGAGPTGGGRAASDRTGGGVSSGGSGTPRRVGADGRVAVAMSGGVDSAVAALLLREAGLDVVGVTMRLLPEATGDLPPTACCSPRSLHDAAAVCRTLGILHHVVDLVDDFEAEVVRPYVSAYAAGRTPNPCVRCNEAIKFDALLRRAEALGCGRLAAGHYARLVHEPGGPSLHAARDAARDQSYFLYRIPRAALGRLLFPLGDLTKEEVRAHARRAGLGVAETPQSMEACFAPDGDVAAFLSPRIGAAGGAIETETGEVLGRHDGHWRFTVGQRRGLGFAGGAPLYVSRVDAARGAVVVVDRPEALDVSEIPCVDSRWLTDVPERFAASARCRSRHRGAPARIRRDGDGFLASFDSPVRRVAPGQSVVLYDGDRLLGGGVVE